MSVVFLEKIDFLCDIEDRRKDFADHNNNDYDYKESNTESIKLINFMMEERQADPTHESLSNYLRSASLQIYHDFGADIEEIGSCETVLEVGISYDRLTFEIEKKYLIEYMTAHPNYQLRVVNTFNSVPTEQRLFRYVMNIAYSTEHIYDEK
jgi:hypothetical protein